MTEAFWHRSACRRARRDWYRTLQWAAFSTSLNPSLQTRRVVDMTAVQLPDRVTHAWGLQADDAHRWLNWLLILISQNKCSRCNDGHQIYFRSFSHWNWNKRSSPCPIAKASSRFIPMLLHEHHNKSEKEIIYRHCTQGSRPQ